MTDIQKILKKLAGKRPIFHSEADFQHALAWEIHRALSKSQVRLEYKPPNLDSRFYVDIWVSDNNFNIVIELKYKTRGIDVVFKNEKFNLLHQSAQDVGRYDFLKDIQRLEEITSLNKNTQGYGILVTNDSAYWKIPKDKKTVDASFRIHQDRIIVGRLGWGLETSEGTKDGREEPISIRNTYKLNWEDYSELVNKEYGKFRYLLVKIY